MQVIGGWLDLPFIVNLNKKDILILLPARRPDPPRLLLDHPQEGVIESRKRNKTKPDPMLEILYEDNHCLALNKPAGLLTQGDATGALSLLDAARADLKARYHKPGNVFLGLNCARGGISSNYDHLLNDLIAGDEVVLVPSFGAILTTPSV